MEEGPKKWTKSDSKIEKEFGTSYFEGGITESKFSVDDSSRRSKVGTVNSTG